MAENMDGENEAPGLINLTRSNPFTTPSNYFDELTGRINQSVFVSNLAKTEGDGFTTPPHYFETLKDEITAQINLGDYHAKDGEGYKIPSGYFEELTKKIEAKTVVQKKAVKLWSQPLFKYAVAACLVVASSTSWLGYQKYQSTQINKVELAKDQTLYDIDESVITEYILENQQAKTSSATTVEMENYILDNFSTRDLSNNL